MVYTYLDIILEWGEAQLAIQNKSVGMMAKVVSIEIWRSAIVWHLREIHSLKLLLVVRAPIKES